MLTAVWDGLVYKTDDPSFHSHIEIGQSQPYCGELDIIFRYLKQNPQRRRGFVDVGAHIGTYSIPMSGCFDRVYSYEAEENNYRLLTENIALNKKDNIQTYHIALGSTWKKSANVVRHQNDNSGFFAVIDNSNSLNLPVVGQIDMQRLDDCEFDTNIDFIKIDVEGSELAVLKGAEGLLERDSPLLEIEINNLSQKLYGISEHDIQDWLQQHGYCFYGRANSDYFYYKPQYERALYMFWLGGNDLLTENRKLNLQYNEQHCGVKLHLITENNLQDWIIPSHPLHLCFPYLSNVHKVDYLRCYFMYHYGGAYCDVKRIGGSLIPIFDLLDDNAQLWGVGYKEVGPDSVAAVGGETEQELRKRWQELFGMGGFCYETTNCFHTTVVRKRSSRYG